MRYAFYRLRPEVTPAISRQEASNFRWEIWRPRGLNVLPPFGAPIEIAWTAMHHLRIFSNPCYAQIVAFKGDELAHRSTIFPRWMRYPFMASLDLQIGNTWTSPQYRGQGLATSAIRRAVTEFMLPRRAFWYIVAKDNESSIAAIERAGFERIGEGARVGRLGVRLLGYFSLESFESSNKSSIERPPISVMSARRPGPPDPLIRSGVSFPKSNPPASGGAAAGSG
jgi:RimJ/RimL family protein N-acetyltransferase